MLVVGIDPSLTATGVALLQVECGLCTVRTVHSRPIRSAVPAELATIRRMNSIRDHVNSLPGTPPAMAVIEAPAFSKNNGMAHERAGLWWKLYELAAEVWQVPVIVVKPNVRAKYATGKGNAGKDEVLLAVSRRYPDIAVTNNNEADAVVLAAMGARLKGNPIERGLPAAHLSAMNTVRGVLS